MSGARRALPEPTARIGLGLLLLAVLAALLLWRPEGGDGADPGGEPSPSVTGLLPTATPATAPSEEAFCGKYRMLAAAQGQYVAQPDERGAEVLREAADDLLATGVPDSMRPGARSAYFVEISGIYATLGENLDRQAVPGAESSADPSSSTNEFSAWLAELCPAW